MHKGRQFRMNILETKNLGRDFGVKTGVFGRATLRAVDGLNVSISENRVHSLVGESGCGKSTVARLLLKLIDPTRGSVMFKGEDLSGLDNDGMRKFRKSVQMIFQDPFASLNPRRSVFDAVTEPLKIHKIVPDKDLRDAASELLGRVGLNDALGRFPHEFSGGQRQRICIARALAVGPEVIVADEPLSSLDVSIQAQILNLLIELKAETGISFIFISHDLRVVEYLSDTVSVMYLGRIVETASAEEIFGTPLHPYTRMLLSSAPRIDAPGFRKKPPSGEVPSPIDLPPGCAFNPRCPSRFDLCERESPALKQKGGSSVACHLYN